MNTRRPHIINSPFDDLRENPVPVRHPGLCLVLVVFTFIVGKLRPFGDGTVTIRLTRVQALLLAVLAGALALYALAGLLIVFWMF